MGDMTLAGLSPPLGISIATSNGARMLELLVSFSFDSSWGGAVSGGSEEEFSGSAVRERLLCRCLEARMAAMKGAPTGASEEGLEESAAATPVRHKGQVECEWSHMSMHSRWKSWPHFGRVRPCSPCSKSSRQTAHSSFLASPENSNVGSDSTTARSRPTLCGGASAGLCTKALRRRRHESVWTVPSLVTMVAVAWLRQNHFA